MKHRILTGFVTSAFLLVLLLLGSPLTHFSQIAGGMTETTRTDFGGRNYITGIVFAPSGMPVKARTRIRLSAPGAEIVTTTDDEGKFVISGLSNGMYTVTIDPDDKYEGETHQVEIFGPRGARGQAHFLHIRLREKGSPKAKAGVVNAELAGVPKKALKFYDKGLALVKEGNLRGAVDQFLLAVGEHPQFMYAHAQLGVLYQKLNELERADQHLVLALQISPEAFDPLANRGIVLVRLKRFEEAEQVLRTAIKLRSDFPVSHYYLGRALVGLKRFDDAEGSFKTAYSLGGKDMIEAKRALAGLYLEKGDAKLALDELEAYLAVNPGAPDAQKLRDTAEELRNHLRNTPKPEK